MIRANNIALSLLSIAMLASCGGGGSEESTTVTPPETTPPPVETPAWEAPNGIGSSMIVDANGDGHNDIVFNASAGVDQTYDYNAMMLYLNDGQGQFAIKEGAFPTLKFESQDEYMLYMDTIKANGDDLADIIAVETNQAEKTVSLHLYLATSEGIYTDASVNIDGTDFTNSAIEVRVADFDGDGYEDFVLTGFNFGCDPTDIDLTDRYKNCIGGTIYLNDGTGSFSSASMTLIESLTSAEYTVDSLRYTNFSEADLAEGFRPGVDSTWADAMISQLRVGDVDNDDKQDIVAHTFSSTSMLASFINKSTPGNLVFEVRHSANVRQTDGALLDVNRDGFLDWVVSEGIFNGAHGVKDEVNETVPLYTLINDGTGVFSEDNSFLVGEHFGVQHARHWLVADFDNDGFDDLIIPDHGNDYRPFPGFRNTLLMNTPSGLIDATESNLTIEKSYSHSGAIGDVNGDGFIDLFFNNSNSYTEGHVEAVPGKRLWINNGDGTFTASDQKL